MSAIAFLRELMEAGVSLEHAMVAAEKHEQKMLEAMLAPLETRRAKDRDRKRPRNSTESADSADLCGIQDNPPEVRPLSPQTPLTPTPTPPDITTRAKRSDDGPEFVAFWAAYPNKSAKDNARKAFATARKRCDLETMLAAIEAQRTWEQWQRGFVPHAASWLNAGRWQDEPPPTPVITLKTVSQDGQRTDPRRLAREANLSSALRGAEAASRFRAER